MPESGSWRLTVYVSRIDWSRLAFRVADDGAMMGFVLRSGFWFSLVLLAMPFGNSDMPDGVEAVGPLQALSAASRAIGDLRGLCEREPGVCETGIAAAQTVSVRARLAYDVIDERFASANDGMATGSIAARPIAVEAPLAVPVPTPAPRG